MGEIPRIHRVDPSPPVAQHLRVARSGDHPERNKGNNEEEPRDEGQRDQVELHSQEEHGREPDDRSEPNNADRKFLQDPEIRLDIAV